MIKLDDAVLAMLDIVIREMQARCDAYPNKRVGLAFDLARWGKILSQLPAEQIIRRAPPRIPIHTILGQLAAAESAIDAASHTEDDELLLAAAQVAVVTAREFLRAAVDGVASVLEKRPVAEVAGGDTDSRAATDGQAVRGHDAPPPAGSQRGVASVGSQKDPLDK